MQAGWDDTIVALATPPGIGAIGIIRLSGPRAIAIVDDLFPGKNLSIQPSHTLHVGVLLYNEVALDEVVISLYKNPRSYTGEDIVEISCHGSPYVQEQVIKACIEKGARLARAGEFTQRAFLNGKLDLTQAEAVADLIASNTEASRKNALHNIRGGFSQVLKELREQLLKFSALIELELDFSQEDVEFADRKQLNELIDNAYEVTTQLLSSFKLGNVIKNGVQVAIVGKPNAGKSTLLNVLLNENRAIVSEIAGTTRDTIEEVLNIKGVLFRLIDTAGIREHTSDIIESIGVERSLEKINQADIIIYLFDVKETSEEDLRNIMIDFGQRNINYILVGNKSDTIASSLLADKFKNIADIIFIAANKNEHIDILKDSLVEKVTAGSLQTEDTIVTNIRHYEALQQVNQSLLDIRNGLANNLPGDLVALDIRRCLHYIGEITGAISNEEQLGYIFGKFCIGK